MRRSTAARQPRQSLSSAASIVRLLSLLAALPLSLPLPLRFLRCVAQRFAIRSRRVARARRRDWRATVTGPAVCIPSSPCCHPSASDSSCMQDCDVAEWVLVVE